MIIPISHPDKLLFPEDGITKGDLADYYESIAPVMLPHVLGRPVTMERFHRGIAAPGFFQKDVSKGFPSWLERVEVPKHGGTVHHPVVTDTRSLVWLGTRIRSRRMCGPDACRISAIRTSACSIWIRRVTAGRTCFEVWCSRCAICSASSA